MAKLHERLLSKFLFYAKWHKNPLHAPFHFGVFFGLSLVLTATLISAVTNWPNVYASAAAVAAFDKSAVKNEQASQKMESLKIADNYIVVLNRGERGAEVQKSFGLKAKQEYRHAINGFSAYIPKGRLEALKKDKRVSYVEEDVTVYALAQAVPSGVRRIKANQSNVALIDGVDNRVNADVAIIDTGVDFTHPDLNVYQHVSFAVDSTDGMDGHGHGTHVAGTVAALDNNIGVVGVAPGARIWAVKALDNSGAGALSIIIKAVDYVTEHADEIEVANMSLGGQGSSGSLRQAIATSVGKGVVYVVAAGNSFFEVYGGDSQLGTSDDFFPAAYPEVMTVSAIVDTDGQSGGAGVSTSYGEDDTLAKYSNWSNVVDVSNPVVSPGASIDIAAPGTIIYSTYKNGAYATMSGTSMASPHVAGAVALYISENGRASDATGVYRIRQSIIDLAEPQSAWGVNKTTPLSNDQKPEGLIDAGNLTTGGSNLRPTISISRPVSQAVFNEGQMIAFLGNAADAEDGDLTAKIEWTSSIDGVLGKGGSFSRNLSSGDHVISAKVSDSLGYSAIATVRISVVSSINSVPSVSILSPLNGAVLTTGTLVGFTGSAIDQEDGDISSRISWTFNGSVLGTGSDVNVTFGKGVFRILASVTDSGLKTATTSVEISVVDNPENTAPSVSIITPAETSSVIKGTEVRFSASASDNEEGNITNRIKWASSIDGNFGTGGDLLYSLFSSGVHTIYANITDSNGLTSSDAVSLTVEEKQADTVPPLVSVTYPSANSVVSGVVTMSASASDNDGIDRVQFMVDGADIGVSDSVAPYTIAWNTDDYTSGSHVISAVAYDTTGNKTISSLVSVVVDRVPTVTITSPTENTFLPGQAVTFRASAMDKEDGDLSIKIKWSSNLDGILGLGSSLSKSLSVGTHIITAEVFDSRGQTASASLVVTVANKLGLSASTDKSIYNNKDTVKITALVSSNSVPVSGAFVSATVVSPTGRQTAYLSGTSDSFGKVVLTYQINTKSGGAGSYGVNLTASKTGFANGTLSITFKGNK